MTIILLSFYTTVFFGLSTNGRSRGKADYSVFNGLVPTTSSLGLFPQKNGWGGKSPGDEVVLPSRHHVTRAAGAGGDGKGKRRKSLSFAFLFTITPRAPLERDRERDWERVRVFNTKEENVLSNFSVRLFPGWKLLTSNRSP